MRHVYSGPVDPPEPCCYEEPDHTHYGYPKPDLDQLAADVSPADARALVRAAIEVMAVLGSETELSDPAEKCAAISDILGDAKPSNLPTITEQYKPAARWWCQVGDMDPHDEDRWTPEEEDE